MNAKQTLLIVILIVLLGEAIADILSKHMEYLAAGICSVIFALVVYSIRKKRSR